MGGYCLNLIMQQLLPHLKNSDGRGENMFFNHHYIELVLLHEMSFFFLIKTEL